MDFTAAEVFRGAQRTAPALRDFPKDKNLIAEHFNDALTELVLDVVSIDEERLARLHDLPTWVLDHDPLDIGWYGADPGVNPSSASIREWLQVGYIDWLDNQGEGGEVWITTLEARHRGAEDYPHQIVGYFHTDLHKLQRVTDWSGVSQLRVYGVLEPTKVTGATLDTVTYTFPRVLEVALRWELVYRLALGLPNVPDRLLNDWIARRLQARARLEDDADTHLSGRIEDIPLAEGY